MVFFVGCVVKGLCSKPIKDWLGCTLAADITLSNLYRKFCTGEFHDEPVKDDNK